MLADSEVHLAWIHREQLGDKNILRALKTAGLPISTESDNHDDIDDSGGKIICVMSISPKGIESIIAFTSVSSVHQSVVAYRLPLSTNRDFWRFAANHYYIVTGNMADRDYLAKEVGIAPSQIKGRRIIRAASLGLSGMTVNEIMASLGYQFPIKNTQQSLF